MKTFACDIILIREGKVLLIKRATDPFKGQWALPGGRVDKGETEGKCARREMKEETGLDVAVISRTGLYSNAGWDPPGKVSAAFLVREVGGEMKAGSDASEVAWFPLDSLPQLCANHGKILADAVRKMKQKG